MIEPTKVGFCPTEMSTEQEKLENVVERWGNDQQTQLCHAVRCWTIRKGVLVFIKYWLAILIEEE